MYIGFNLGCDVPTVDLDSIKKYDYQGNLYFLYENNIYYPKEVNLNEFIGEELANKMSLSTVSYKLFKNIYGEIFIASRNFRKSNYTYYHPSDFEEQFPIYNHLESWKSICQDKENYFFFLEAIFKLFSIDIYMKQNDRWNSNIQIEKSDTGYVNLAPVYDYSEASWYDSICYPNTLHSFYNEYDYEVFFNKYPNFLEFLKTIKKVEMSKIIENIQASKNIVIDSQIKDIYLRREEESQKKLEKIIK